MDRMLSGYLDKMVFDVNTNYLPQYRSCVKERGKRVILGRTNSGSNPIIILPNCTMQEAARQAASSSENKFVDSIPTFEEFLEFILSIDLHGIFTNKKYNAVINIMIIYSFTCRITRL